MVRKDAYLKHLKSASRNAWLIACADKINNLSSICEAYAKDGDKIWKSLNASKEAKIGFYESIYKEVAKRLSHPIVRELGCEINATKRAIGLKNNKKMT